MALRWVATQTIWTGQYRAFNAGDVVPDSVEARWNSSGQGLVTRIPTDEDEFPDADLGIPTRSEVVLKSNLWLGPTPPPAPLAGTVWIDTSA